VSVAILAGRSRRFIQGRAYCVVTGVLGILLAAFAALLFRQGYLYLA
jgi:hypothetical protein